MIPFFLFWCLVRWAGGRRKGEAYIFDQGSVFAFTFAEARADRKARLDGSLKRLLEKAAVKRVGKRGGLVIPQGGFLDVGEGSD